MGRVALIGSNGQLGSDIVRLWSSSDLAGEELVCLTHADMDVRDVTLVRSILMGVQPTLVINTAAYHRVDDCERTPMEAFEVNAIAVKHLAEACRDLGASLMHFSTDYVFGGDKTTPYREDDLRRPVSAYGISKMAGEDFLRYTLPDGHILVRCSGLYGVAGASGKGGNFVETMLRLAREGRPLRVVEDQVLCPTYTLDLAETLLQIIARGGRGTFHVSNAGECSWFEFASEIFELLNLQPDLTPVTSEEFASPARRPAYSVLDNARLRDLDIEQPRPWREALQGYLRLKGQLAE